MPADADPPRKFYGFKPREFERANPPRPAGSAPDSPAPAPAATPPPEQKIDVRELIRTGAGAGPQLGSNQAVNRANEVHDLLRANLARDQAAGHYDLGVLDDSKRRRRIRNYWIAVVAINAPLGAFAWWIGHANALPFVCAIAAMALLTSRLTWETFFLRTHY
jgi:hypothetical protein